MTARSDSGEKHLVNIKDLHKSVGTMLDDIQKSLYEKAVKFLESHVTIVSSYDELKKVLKEKGGIVTAPWCGSDECEIKIKEETGAKITNIPNEQGKFGAKCIYCGKKSKHAANFAKSY